jgi:tRNA threonylcarbamoyladenosine biosynthesis protein TsaE
MSYLPATVGKKDQLKIHTTTTGETSDFGCELGHRLKPGTVILLTGDLGSGKTTFVQGMARGLGVPDSYYVTSPTYTIVNEYPGRQYLYHMDLYRITEPDELDDIGVADRKSVV